MYIYPMKGSTVMHSAKRKRYDCLGPRVVESLQKRGFDAYYCSEKEQVVSLILSLIPQGHTVSWGGSVTLVELGVQEAVMDAGYAVINRDAAQTPEERVELMRRGLLADTFLASSNAISADGILVNIDGNGNRVAAMIYGPKNVIVVAGMNKVEADRELALRRARTQAAPMVVQRFPGKVTPCMMTGCCGDCKSDDCICSYIAETRMCRPQGRIKVILVGEDLGL